jgi:HAD superfamily hydrolase (TIGR01509 family)
MKKFISIESYSGVIFDLDGTLINSNWVWRQIDIEFLGKRGFDVPEDYMKIIAPMGFEATADYTIKRFGLKETREAVVKEWYDMAIDAYSNRVFLKDGVKEYLSYLKENGKLMSVATASDMRLVEPVLKNNGIEGYFNNITTLKEVNRGKGFPDIYDKSAEKMNIESDKCIVFEDIIQGIKGAKDGGYRTVGVYDEHFDNDKEKIKKICDMYIQDFKEMIKYA